MILLRILFQMPEEKDMQKDRYKAIGEFKGLLQSDRFNLRANGVERSLECGEPRSSLNNAKRQSCILSEGKAYSGHIYYFMLHKDT